MQCDTYKFTKDPSLQVSSSFAGDDLVCRYEEKESGGPELTNKHLCLPQHYNKFDLPFPNDVNPIDIGIDITDGNIIFSCKFCIVNEYF